MIRNQKQFDQALDALPEWRRQQLARVLRALAEMPTPEKKTGGNRRAKGTRWTKAI